MMKDKKLKPNHSDFSINQNIHCEWQALMNEFAGKALSFRTLGLKTHMYCIYHSTCKKYDSQIHTMLLSTVFFVVGRNITWMRVVPLSCSHDN